MHLTVHEQPTDELVAFLDQKIDEYNWQYWEVKQRSPLAVSVCDERGEIVAGAAGRSFGRWLLLDNLWVSESLRGQDWGRRVLLALEQLGRERGCVEVMLDTLDFQAKPFYEKHGYLVRWTQAQYPETGCKYFMTKSL